ncbi:MAG TPA: glutathione S-transferase family protein, partial [Nevskiaceae bacterium]|nr:glutathione S-transferase family protein [Nevskiaceae bacterium]
MSAIKLVIGDKSRSSWSLRAWLFLRHHQVPFTEQVIALDRAETHAEILKHSPSGRVPVLVHGQVHVWESSAICEYAAETFALPGAWPMTPASRALARSIAAEMHAGFADLRRELPFDARRDPSPKDYSERTAADIRRICAIWREARPKSRGDGWLFGSFGIVDAMYAPVALRLHAYAVKLDAGERDYVDQVLRHPAVES